MALTLEAEQRLEAAGLIKLFDEHEAAWTAAAKKTYAFVKDGFPKGAKIRRDDVSKALLPILNVDETLGDKLDEEKLRGQFWKNYFSDLIIDRVWDEISKGA